MSVPKLALLGFWGVLIVVAAVAGGTLATAARVMLGVLVIGHVAECVIFISRLRQAGGSLPGQLLQTLVFGLFHLRELPRT